MRPDAVSDRPEGQNPLRHARKLRGLSRKAFAELVGLSLSQLCLLEEGQASHLRDSHRDGFERAGIDFSEMQRAYALWRDALVGGGKPVVEVTPANDYDRAIAAAIARGVRGCNAIAHAAGMPAAYVRQYLRNGTTEAIGEA